jgi:hypothetical protein
MGISPVSASSFGIQVGATSKVQANAAAGNAPLTLATPDLPAELSGALANLTANPSTQGAPVQSLTMITSNSSTASLVAGNASGSSEQAVLSSFNSFNQSHGISVYQATQPQQTIQQPVSGILAEASQGANADISERDAWLNQQAQPSQVQATIANFAATGGIPSGIKGLLNQTADTKGPAQALAAINNGGINLLG